MATFLDDAINATGNAASFLGNGANATLNPNDFTQNGFVVAATPNADGNGLPSSKVDSSRVGMQKRSAVHWFVPEFGVVKMYINPRQIQYRYAKLIQKDRTKGGFTLQYWGEELPVLTLSGTTGTSGIEGINVLYEIYRAEQLAFDGIGLTLAANNSAQGAAEQIIGGVGSAIGGAVGGEIAKGLFGVDSSAQALAPRNIPSLAQFAFGVEMFYLGWVHRGYFTSMDVNESADQLGLFDYTINFVVTERRGYRFNNLPWQRSAKDGQSGDTIPRTFSTLG